MYIIRNYGHSMSKTGGAKTHHLSHHSWRGGLADPTYLGAMSDPKGHRMPPAENLDTWSIDFGDWSWVDFGDWTHSTPKKRGTHG